MRFPWDSPARRLLVSAELIVAEILIGRGFLNVAKENRDVRKTRVTNGVCMDAREQRLEGRCLVTVVCIAESAGRCGAVAFREHLQRLVLSHRVESSFSEGVVWTQNQY